MYVDIVISNVFNLNKNKSFLFIFFFPWLLGDHKCGLKAPSQEHLDHGTHVGDRTLQKLR